MRMLCRIVYKYIPMWNYVYVCVFAKRTSLLWSSSPHILFSLARTHDHLSFTQLPSAHNSIILVVVSYLYAPFGATSRRRNERGRKGESRRTSATLQTKRVFRRSKDGLDARDEEPHEFCAQTCDAMHAAASCDACAVRGEPCEHASSTRPRPCGSRRQG